MSDIAGIVVPLVLVLVLIAVVLFVTVVQRDGWTNRPRTWTSRLIYVGIAAAVTAVGFLLLSARHRR